MNPYFANLVGALLGSQYGPKQNDVYDNPVDYNPAGEPLDEKGRLATRYVQPSIWTKVFNPSVAGQITQAETAYQMQPELAARDNAIRMGIAAKNLSVGQPYFSNPDVSSIPPYALARLTGGQSDLGSAFDVSRRAALLQAGIPVSEAEKEAAGNRLETSRLNYLNDNNAGQQFGSEALFGSALGEAGAKAGLKYDVPTWQARASSTGNQLATQRNIYSLPLIPAETDLQRKRISVEGNQLGREIAAKPLLDTTYGNTAKTGALDSGTQLAIAGQRSNMADIMAKATGNQIVADYWRSGHIAPDITPRVSSIDGTKISFNEPNPAFVAPALMQMEAMKGLDKAMSSGIESKVSNFNSLPRRENAVDVRTGNPPAIDTRITLDRGITKSAATTAPTDFDQLNSTIREHFKSNSSRSSAISKAVKAIIDDMTLRNPDSANFIGGSNLYSNGISQEQAIQMFNQLRPTDRQSLVNQILSDLGIKK